MQKGWRQGDPGGREKEGKDKGSERGPHLTVNESTSEISKDFSGYLVRAGGAC